MAPERDRRAISRRRFAALATGGVGAVVGAMFAVPIVGTLIDPLFHGRPLVWRKVGDVGRVAYETPTPFTAPFPTQDSWKVPDERYVVYVVRHRNGRIDTFSNICTHMQCPVRWDTALGLFLCPCHGGLYNLSGVNVGGPPPKPLPRWESRVDRSGTLWVRNVLNEDI